MGGAGTDSNARSARVCAMNADRRFGDMGPAPAEPSHSRPAAIFSTCRQHAGLIAGWDAVWLVIAALVTFNLRPMYLAEADLVLDTRVQHLSDIPSVMSGPLTMPDPSPTIRSEAQALK